MEKYKEFSVQARNGIFTIVVYRGITPPFKAIITGVLPGLAKIIRPGESTPIMEEEEFGPVEVEENFENTVIEKAKVVIEKKSGPVISCKEI